ncbi:MAG: fasciclin domain-containing protein [Solirubrobacterales bacterium]|nr:fasciclin domain-containing protein [Solirubrobacterales bacterium]
MTAADIAGRMSAEALQGNDPAVSNNGVIRSGGACVVSGDRAASNGVIHVIDRVLLPARI